jgi:hypothetical protein
LLFYHNRYTPFLYITVRVPPSAGFLLYLSKIVGDTLICCLARGCKTANKICTAKNMEEKKRKTDSSRVSSGYTLI